MSFDTNGWVPQVFISVNTTPNFALLDSGFIAQEVFSLRGLEEKAKPSFFLLTRNNTVDAV